MISNNLGIWADRPRQAFGDLKAIMAGTGPRLVLLHGVGLRAEAWAAQIDALAEIYEVIAPDMAAHGDSTAFSAEPNLRDFSDRVAAALSEPVFLAGHSMGAMIALDIAHRYPERVRGIAALNGVFERNAKEAESVRSRADNLDGKTAADPEPTLKRWFGNEPSAERAACQSWLTSVNPAAYQSAYSAFATSDLPSAKTLQTIECPAVFITGAEEPNSTPKMSLAMAEHTPNGQAVIIAGAAHMMPMTHIAQTNSALRHFAQQVLT